MIRETLFRPEQSESDMLVYIPHELPMTATEKKAVVKISHRQHITPAERSEFLNVIHNCVAHYKAYARQDLPVGGIIFNEAAAEGLKANWLHIADKWIEFGEEFNRGDR